MSERRNGDALAVLRNSTRKVARIAADVQSATRRRDEIRLRELIELREVIKVLGSHVNGAIDSLQVCFRL